MIGVVVNPHAGRNRRQRQRLQRLEEIVGKSGIVVEPPSLGELDTVLRQFERRGVSILAVCGGDGSFFRTLSSAARIYGTDRLPRFLPLRAGSMNTIARSVGCRSGSPEKVLAQIVADLRAGRELDLTESQLICVNGDELGFMTGAGAVVNFLQAYYNGNGRGPLAAVSVFGRAALSALARSEFAERLLTGIDADIHCDGDAVAQRYFNFLYASSINEIGLGIRVTYRGAERRGFFHLIAGDLRPMEAVRRIPRLRRGLPLDLPTVFDSLAQAVRIEFPKPTHYMIDGDVLGAVRQLDLVSGPRLTILR